jgi:dTDP-4-dehydrorhamnose 3,5-epimerase
MKILKSFLDDVQLIELSSKISDNITSIEINNNDLSNLNIPTNFIQENQVFSHKNVLRGLHYQISKPQGKLIHVLRGSIFDVFLDVRIDSKNFGKFDFVQINAKDNLLLWIPPGYAHGYLSLEEGTLVSYKINEYRFQEYERTIMWSDPNLEIPWPNLGSNPIISEKDLNGMLFKDLLKKQI